MKVWIASVILCFGIAAHASADDEFANESYELFPLAEMDSEINKDLQTTTEIGQKQAMLVVDGSAELPPAESSLIVTGESVNASGAERQGSRE